MKRILFLLILIFSACKSEEKSQAIREERLPFSAVEVEELMTDSISIRAIEIMGNNVAFAGSNGRYGIYDAKTGKVKMSQQKHDTLAPEFRSVASTENDFFMLSVANPALLYKTGENGEMQLVYKEEDEKVFYDSMDFWNDKEGIAMGDPTGDCLSIIITRDGGKSWKKLSCDKLPETADGEAAFAASDSNIAIEGDKTWIISGGAKSRVFFSPDRGRTWEVFETPIVQGSSTQGAYSVDFYDEERGVIIGGDYTAPEKDSANIALSTDGGRSWDLIGSENNPGYKSSIRFVPGGGGKELISVGFSGISYSEDGGESWKDLSKEGFYTLRFLNDTVAYAAGKNRLARLVFK